MLVLQVTVQVKPENLSDYLALVRCDAEHSEQDEPGCLRFDVIQDRDDPTRLYCYEVYRDEATLEARRQTPRFKHYLEKSRTWLGASPELRLGRNVIPADAGWR